TDSAGSETGPGVQQREDMPAETAKDGLGVCVVGVGAQTPVGRSAPASAAAVRAKLGNFAEHPYMLDAAGEPMRVARAPWLPAELPLADRVLALTEAAAREALRPLEALAPGGKRVLAAVMGLSSARPGLPAEWCRVLGDRLLGWFKTPFGL